MLIGVPKEIKNFEYRVGLVPSSVRELVENGHQVMVEKGAGEKISFDDSLYACAGARIVETAAEIYATADMIVKVKEPQPSECKMLRENQLLFTYLHLAPDPEQARLLEKSGCVAVAYETVTSASGRLPLLAPMSEVAGRLAVQAGANSLEIKKWWPWNITRRCTRCCASKSCGIRRRCSRYKLSTCSNGNGCTRCSN